MVRYLAGDKVTYGIHGLCEISEIKDMDFAGKTEKYYVLAPISDTRSTVFVPCQNELLVDRMRRVMTASEIKELIRIMPDADTFYIENNVERKRYFSSVIAGGDKGELIKVIKTLNAEKERRAGLGKKFNSSDEAFLKEAEKLLFEEFTYVLNIERDQVIPFILGEFGINEK